MTPEQFMENFGVIAEAPGGIAKLRSLVMGLALRGRLSLPDIDQERVDLLAAAAIHKKDEGPRRRQKPLSKQPSPEITVPQSWAWCRVDDVATSVQYGFTAKANTRLTNVRFLRITDIQDGRVEWSRVPGCEIDSDKLEKFRLEDGDVVIARTGGTIGKSFRISGLLVPAVFASYLIRIRPTPALSPNFFTVFLRSSLYWTQLYEGAAGTGQPNVSATTLRGLWLPLPPLAEQKRIVAKVDQLMAMLDDLEQRQEKKRTVAIHVSRASLDRLVHAEDPDQLARAWERVSRNFGVIAGSAKRVQRLREAIFQLAFSGLLVGSRYRHTARVGDFVELQNGFAFKSTWFKEAGVRLVRNANIGHGTLGWGDAKYVSIALAEEYQRFAMKEGDIVLALDRPLIKTGVKVARLSKQDLPSLLLQRVARATCSPKFLDSNFFFWWLQSRYYTEGIDPGRSKGVPHISTKQILNLPFPELPPLAEQERCVTRLEQLLATINSLAETQQKMTLVRERIAMSAVTGLRH